MITRRKFIKIVGGISIMMLTKNFSVAEVECSCGCGSADMDPDFMKILQNIREEMLK